ncbi:MAG: tetratricopeptide repeat protein, partial [Gammaproteobacteria bacterium]
HLSELRAREGDLPRALVLASQAAANHSSDWWPQEREGELRAAAGDFAAARECFRRACALRPGDPSLLYKFARAAFDCGDIDTSQDALASASRLAPGQPAILALQAEILLRRADWEALERHASGWLLRMPQEPVALRHLARSQWERGFMKAGISSLEAALRAQVASRSRAWPRPEDGHDAETLATLARLHLAVLDYEAAGRALAESEAIDPLCTHMLSTRAILAMYQGDFALAEQSARRSLAIDPRDAAAWKVLVQLRGGWVDTADAASIARLEADDSVPQRDRATLAYALGDCLDAQGETDAAFAAWSRANARSAELARAEGLRYDAPAREREIDAIIRRFPAAAAADDAAHAPAVP